MRARCKSNGRVSPRRSGGSTSGPFEAMPVRVVMTMLMHPTPENVAQSPPPFYSGGVMGRAACMPTHDVVHRW